MRYLMEDKYFQAFLTVFTESVALIMWKLGEWDVQGKGVFCIDPTLKIRQGL